MFSKEWFDAVEEEIGRVFIGFYIRKYCAKVNSLPRKPIKDEGYKAKVTSCGIQLL